MILIGTVVTEVGLPRESQILLDSDTRVRVGLDAGCPVVVTDDDE